MSDGVRKNEKGLIHLSRAILSWPWRLLTRWCRSTWSWSFWRDWPAGVKCIAVIWMLLPFPHLYEILKVWLPWIYPLLDWLGINLPALVQAEQDQSSFDHVRTSMLVVAAWYGVFFLIWRTVLVDRQTQATDKQTEINRESHYTELFTKAVEQLGAVRERQGQEPEPALEIRIGAIYALERLAKDSERDYGPIIETLAAYIREHCRDPKFFDDKELEHARQEWIKLLDTHGDDFIWAELNEEWRKWLEPLREKPPADRSDVAAALTVLSRREKNRNWKSSTSGNETQPDFTGANFQGATLGNTIEGLIRDGTNLRLAHLEGADLSDADLLGADLWGADLSGADLSEAYLLGATLIRANLSNTTLIRANLLGTDLLEANLSNAELIGADLSCAELSGTNLSNAELSFANLLGSNLDMADLSGANLERAYLPNTNLWRADLSGANLRGVDLSDATFESANLLGANIDGALLAGAQLKDSKGLTDDMIKEAFGDNETTLPDGLTRPEHWGSGKDAIEQWQTFWK